VSYALLFGALLLVAFLIYWSLASRRGRRRYLGAVMASGMLGIGLVVVAVRLPIRIPTNPEGVPSALTMPTATVSPSTGTAAFVSLPMFAPYFETWANDSPAAMAQQAGVKHLVLAFLLAPTSGSCTVYWNGDAHRPASPAVFGADIASIRANGGDVTLSFGGGAEEDSGLEVADSCADINSIAAAYESVISTYRLTRIDFDIEGKSASDRMSVDRRNKALKLVEDWAARQGRTLRVSYTLSASSRGLTESAMGIVRNAVSNGVRVDLVNIMSFDYCDGENHSMAAATVNSVTGMHDQLQELYPDKSPAEVRSMVGITVMIGIDDCGAGEIFTVSDVSRVANWAASNGVALLSFWALQRDNGGCPGAPRGSDRCSGLAQSTWQFSQAFAPFVSLR
jgi:hypothetical protein